MSRRHGGWSGPIGGGGPARPFPEARDWMETAEYAIWIPGMDGVFRQRDSIRATSPEAAAEVALAQYTAIPAVYLYVPYSGTGHLFTRVEKPVAQRAFVDGQS